MKHLLLALLLGSALATGQTLSAPHAFGSFVQGTGSAGDTDELVSAFDGTNYLLAWRDFRRSPYAADIYAARVTPAGVLLDPGGIPVCTAPNDQFRLSMVFDGTNYLLAWTDSREGSVNRAYAAHVTPAGTVLEPDGFPIPAANGGGQDHPVVGTTGTKGLVVWSEYVSGLDLWGIEVSAAGVVGAPIQITSESGQEYADALAWNGSEYLLGLEWASTPSAPSDVQAIRLSSNGSPIDPAPFSVAAVNGEQELVSAASNGTDFLLAWADDRTADRDVFGTTVSAAGAVGFANGEVINDNPNIQDAPSVSWNGTQYLVTFEDGNLPGVQTTRVTSSGAVVDTTGFPLVIDTVVSWPTLNCANGAQCALIYSQDDAPERDPFFQRFTLALQPVDPAPKSGFTTTATQSTPRAAFDGTNWLVVWQEDRGIGDDLDAYAQLISPTGAAISPVLTLGAGPGDQRTPDVDFAFGNYLVTWTEDPGTPSDSVFVRRISPQGAFIDPSPVLVSVVTDVQDAARVAHTNAGWMVTWEASFNGSTGFDVLGARVAPDGAVLDTNGFPVAASNADEREPAISCTSEQCLIAWSRLGGTWDLRASRVALDGGLLDAAGGIRLDSRNFDEDAVAVASDGRDFLLAWRSWESYPGDVYARRMRADGGLPESAPVRLVQGPFGEGLPTAFHDGRTYWVGWEDFRDAGTAELYGTTITSAGEVTNPEGVPWVIAPNDQVQPSLARSTRGQLLLLYAEADQDAGVIRGRARTIDAAAPNGGFCLSTSDCASGFCVDGVCCDGACGNGAPDDCLACSEAQGAIKDGTCSAASAGTVCRRRVSSCDVEEVCDGVSTSCPADVGVPDGGCAGAADAGDGGAEAGSTGEYRVGCGCSATGGVLGGALWAFAVLMRRRRR